MLDSQTFFTFMLSLVFAAGLGAATYAMSIAVIEPTLARWGVGAAWLAGIILCVWYGGTNDMPRFGRYAIAGVVAACLTVGLCAALEYIRNRASPQTATNAPTETPLAHPPQSEAPLTPQQLQLAKLRELESFIGKDENGLRQAFDIQGMLGKNIEVQKIRIGFRESGKIELFKYNHYTEGDGSFIFLAMEGKYHFAPSGGPVADEGPRDVLFLITTARFQVAQAKLSEFLNSALVPEAIKL